jgi:hypothetical protein
MGHDVPNEVGADLAAAGGRIARLVGGYTAMGTTGMARHAEHAEHVPGPENTRPEGPRVPAGPSLKLQDSQQRLSSIWQAIQSGRPGIFTSVVIPSLSLDPDELSKIPGAPFYEERLLFLLIRLRDPRARVVYVTSQPIHPEIIDYYLHHLVGVSALRARRHATCRSGRSRRGNVPRRCVAERRVPGVARIRARRRAVALRD